MYHSYFRLPQQRQWDLCNYKKIVKKLKRRYFEVETFPVLVLKNGFIRNFFLRCYLAAYSWGGRRREQSETLFISSSFFTLRVIVTEFMNNAKVFAFISEDFFPSSLSSKGQTRVQKTIKGFNFKVLREPKKFSKLPSTSKSCLLLPPFLVL